MSDNVNQDLAARFSQAQAQHQEQETALEDAGQGQDTSLKGAQKQPQVTVKRGFHKTQTEGLENADFKDWKKIKSDRSAGVKELLGSSVIRLASGQEQSNLLVTDSKNSNLIGVRSETSPESKSIEETKSRSKMRQAKGLEKVIASSQIVGLSDYSPGNIVIQKTQDKTGRVGGTLEIASHSSSFTEFSANFDTLIETTANNCQKFGYRDAIERGDLSFSVDEYSTALGDMTTRLEKNVDASIDRPVADLEEAGFEAEELKSTRIVRDATNSLNTSKRTETVNDFDSLKQSYKTSLSENIKRVKDFSAKTKIISQYTGVDDKFKKGGWLQEFADSPTKDPVEYACQNNIQIDGKNALQWSYDNQYEAKPGRPFYKDYLHYESLLAKDESQLTAEDNNFIGTISSESANYHHDKITFDRGEYKSKLSPSDREFISDMADKKEKLFEGIDFSDFKAKLDAKAQFADSQKEKVAKNKTIAKSVVGGLRKMLTRSKSDSSPSYSPPVVRSPLHNQKNKKSPQR